nr:unnamed protein product [Digitaria exilis]
MDSLPGDVLGDVLALLPPRSLAACRGVCKAWRAAVDAGGLLRSDLLPLSVRGFFIGTDMPSCPFFFRRPSSSSTARKIAGAGLDYLQDMGYDQDIAMIRGYCNGLLLLDQCVANPATRRWARLPPYPPSPEKMEGFHYKECIAFEPAVSPHYRVVRLPYVPISELEGKFDGGIEWPMDPFVIQVFSSGSQRWEHRLLVREQGEAAARCTLGDTRQFYSPYSVTCHDAVFWHQALYVKCMDGFLIRVSLSDDSKYQVIKMPTRNDGREADLRIGKSKNGVYCALLHGNHQLQVWLLHEFGGKRDWVLMHDANLDALWKRVTWKYSIDADGPWKLDTDYCGEANEKPEEEEELEWDSDNDNVLNIEDVDSGNWCCYIPIIGFHPYKEVIFFHVDLSSAIAYHWNSSKFQFMGNLYVMSYAQTSLESYSVYTPCWIGDLS